MPEGRIDLEEGLLDSPQVRNHVGKIEKCLGPYKEYTALLKDTFQACNIHQEKVCEGTEALSKLLAAFQSEAMESQEETLLTRAFFRLSRYLSELHSCQEMLSTQLENAVIELLSQFITNDFGKLEKLKDNYETAMQEHEQATMKYSRVSRRKDSEKVRFEANGDLFAPRRKFYESSLDYFAELNCFEHKKKFALLEPLLTFMHAQMAYFKVGHEILNKELGTLLTDLNTEVQRVHDNYQKEVTLSREVKADLELQFPTLCIPDPDPTDPFTDQPLLPNTSLTSKAGYLFIRTQSGFPSKWDKIYFFTKKGCLYLHIPPKLPELIVHLKGAEASATELDDRRYVFVVNHSSLKRPIYLLAESDLQKEEWIATINNISYDRGQAQPHSNVQRDEAVIKIEREKIRSWVNKEIDPKKDKEKNTFPKTFKATPSFSKTMPTAPTPSPASSTFSLPSFLNFLDPTNQSNQSNQPDHSSSKHSPISSRKTSATTTVAADHTLSKEEEKKKRKLEEKVSIFSSSLSLQPERLTTGTTTPTETTPTAPAAATGRPPRASFSKTFYVKYLGHMEVQEGRNINVIMDTIQKVQSARALKNVREAQAIEMTISHRSITLFDHNAKKGIGQIVLRDILRCAVQPESVKLFGIVNRTTGDGDKSKFLCHVMESDHSGSQVCTAINEAIQVAIRILQSSTRQSRSKSTATQPQQGSKQSLKVEHETFSQHHKSVSDSSLATMGVDGRPHAATPLVSASSKSSIASEDSIGESQISSSDYISCSSTTPLPIPPPTSIGTTPSAPPSYFHTNSLPTLSENQISTVNSLGGGGGGLTGAPPGGGGGTSYVSSLGSTTGGPPGSGGGGVGTSPVSSLPFSLNLDDGRQSDSLSTASGYFQVPGTSSSSSEAGGLPPLSLLPSSPSNTFSLDTYSNGDEEDFSLPPLDDFMESNMDSRQGGEGGGGSIMKLGNDSTLESGYFQAPSSFISPDSANNLQTKSNSDSYVGDGMGLSGTNKMADPSNTGQDGQNGGIGGGGGGGASGFYLDAATPSDSLIDSGYLPAPNTSNSFDLLDTIPSESKSSDGGLEMFNNSTTTATTITTTRESTQHPTSLPTMEGDYDYGDDDFDLPPLPDSMMGAPPRPPPHHHPPGTGQGGYGGSIVALGNMQQPDII